MTVFAPVFRLSEQRGKRDGENTCNVVVAMGLVAVGLAGTTPSAFGGEPELLAMRILVGHCGGRSFPTCSCERRPKPRESMRPWA